MAVAIRPVVLVTLCLTGCAGVEPTRLPEPAPVPEPPVPVSDTGGVRIAATAENLVGSRYRFGGSGPHEFDCSGLVFYVHRENGIEVPRTAAEQFLLARPVPREALRAGDLVFFRNGGAEVTHVGVYIGDGAFVHAPKTGRPVTHARLDDEYYLVNFAGAGRLYRLP
jgi:cell wall-associated NlpC family hydrolase